MNSQKSALTFICSLLLLHLISSVAMAENYTLDLKSQDWKLNAKGIFLKEIIDERNDKSVGVALRNGNKIPAQFPNSIEKDLLQLITSSATFDTTGVPLIMGIELFSFQERGSMMKHTASLYVKAHFYREHAGKKYEIVELESKPSLEMSGPVPYAQEKIIQSAMKDFISGLMKMLDESPNLPQMVRSAKIIMDPIPSSAFDNRDTLYWSPKLRLSWNDFKGPNPTSPFSAESSCVFTYNAYTKVVDKVLEIHVTMAACFNTQNSWVRKELMRDSLLMHEQLHFDICESEIRNLKGTLLTINADPFDFDNQIRTAFNEAWERYKVIQRTYDEETQHGIVYDKQVEWINRITEELKEARN